MPKTNIKSNSLSSTLPQASKNGSLKSKTRNSKHEQSKLSSSTGSSKSNSKTNTLVLSKEESLKHNSTHKNSKLKKKSDSLTKSHSTKLKSIEPDLTFAEIEQKIFDGSELEPKVKRSTRKNKFEVLDQSASISKIAFSNSSCIEQSSNKDAEIFKSRKSNSNSCKKKKKNESHGKCKPITKSQTKANPSDKLDSNSEASDWEDVDELSELLKNSECSKTTDENVQIELEANNVLWGIKKRKRRSEQQMIQDFLRKQANKSIKEVHINMHKTHLLCLFAHGLHINACLALETVLSSALSLIPKSYFTPKRLDLTHLEKFLTWFHSCIVIKNDKKGNEATQMVSFEEILQKRFENKFACNSKEFVLMFVALGRSVGMTVRLIQSLSPLPWKPPGDSLIKPIKSPDDSQIYSQNYKNISPTIDNDSVKNEQEKKSKTSAKSQVINQNSKCKKKKLQRDRDSDDDEYESRSKKLKSKVHSDEDFEESAVNSASSSNKRDKCKNNSLKRQNSETDKKKKKPKMESLKEWAEVYVEEEERWISVDVTKSKIHCTPEIEARCSNLAYIVAFNPDQTVKDVTKRYVSNWLSSKDKIQCDGNWWTESLKPFLGKKDRRDREEDKDLEDNLRMQPLPKTLGDYKNHPLYALQRHLLKFEAIYPPDEAPVGFFKGEPVFPRSSVKTLNGREQWIKEAKCVRVGEEPYKVVKGRPKWDKNLCQVIKDRPLELFGEWQIEDYEPPIAKNGKVPRNEYGNVELFKPCMLPRGCIHLQINGISRIARKLNIDCAPAVVGFDFHSGGSHPILDGFVVCEEFVDIIMDAWNQDQVEQAKKEEEKRLKRIYDNWKKLITGITLKDRLKERYGVITPQDDFKETKNESVETKKKIKQKDLDSISSHLITHAVPNLKIDFTSEVASKTLNKKLGKVNSRQIKTKLHSNRGGEASENINAISSSNSEDEATLEEKRERIRTILRWNPDSVSKSLEPALSDASENEETTTNPKQKLPSMKPRLGNKLTKGSSLKLANLTRKRSNKFSFSSESESDPEETTAISPKRRPRRNRNTKTAVKYAESDYQSEPDISLDESDTGDKAYSPPPEVAKPGISLLSESD